MYYSTGIYCYCFVWQKSCARTRSLHFIDRMCGQDELCTPSTHTSIEASRSAVFSDVWVDMVLTPSVPSNSR